MKMLLNILAAITIFFLLCSTGCLQSKNTSNQPNNKSFDIKKLTGNEISGLEIGKTVRFPAILVRHIGSNCVDLFTEDEFKKYDGDAKWAVTSKFVNQQGFMDSLFGKKNVIVTGRMSRVKNETDTSKTCGFVTGNIFEITEIEELK